MDEAKKNLHLKELKTTAYDFAQMSRDLADQSNMSINFLGAVVDNTAASVLSAYNALSDTPQRLVFTHHSNWFNYMSTVHRNFFTNLLAHMEEGIKLFCEEQNISVGNKRERFVRQISKTFGCEPRSDREYKKLISYVGATPEFKDYIAAATNILTTERKTYWRDWFAALNILRNKSSHSNSDLTATQIETLIKGGFSKQIQGTNIGMNTALYKPLINETIAFFKEIERSTAKK